MEQLIILAVQKIKMPRCFAAGLALSVIIFEMAVPKKYRVI